MLKLYVLTQICYSGLNHLWAPSGVYLLLWHNLWPPSAQVLYVHVILCVCVVHVDSVPASQCTSAVHVILCDCCASQFPVEDSVCLCPSVPVSVVSSQCTLNLDCHHNTGQ